MVNLRALGVLGLSHGKIDVVLENCHNLDCFVLFGDQ